jgi:hypothetical protein
MRLIIILAMFLFTASGGTAGEWQRYTDPAFGYEVELPDEGFDTDADPARNGLTLYEQNGRGQIDVYAISNDQRLGLKELRDALSRAERIRQITYSRAGASWFVISGYYRRASDEKGDLIFYAKFMLSADRRSFSAFEASYPAGDKERYDPIIERIEDTLTRPAR